MRITCDSCGAKYNVADEKVQGKIVKIRCKKCSNVILVNGKIEAFSAAEAPVAPSSHGASHGEGSHGEGALAAVAVYHVNVAENDQRELQMSEIVAGYREGWITNDMFVWTEGMGDWLPLEQVDVIVAAVRQDAPRVSAPYVSTPSVDALSSEALSSEALSEGYLAAIPPAGPSAEARRVRRDEAREGRDLFAAPSASSPFAFPSSSTQATSETADVAHASRPAPAGFGEAPGLTGERGEDSVLFNVGALAVKQPEAPSKENSGVIDLRALVAANEERTTAAVQASEAPVMSLFAAGPAAFDTQAGISHARHQEPRKPKRALGAFVGLAGVGLLVASGAAALVAMNKPVPASVAESPPTLVARAPADPPAKVNEVAQLKAEPASLVSLDDPNEKKNLARPGPPAVARPAPHSGDTPPVPPPVVVKKPSGGGDPCGGDLTCMMRNSVKKRPK